MIISFSLGIIGGLLSGVLVYLARQKMRADRLRKAISMDIRKSTPVGTFTAAVMGKNSLETPIIDRNLDKIYLLNKHEIALVANYQRHMSQVQAISERESSENSVYIPMRLQKKGGDIAKTTSDTLEKNIGCVPNLISWAKAKIFEGEKRRPIITEEEAEEKRRELREQAKEYRKKKTLENSEQSN